MGDIEIIVAHFLPGFLLADALLFFLLIFTRILVMTLIMPMFGAELLPSAVRVALSAIFSAIAFMTLKGEAHGLSHLSSFFLFFLFIKEALVGFIIGFSASLLFFAYGIFGELVDLARGANMSKMLVPELKHQSSPMGTLFFQLALVLFFRAGFHHDVIQAIYKSLERFPVRLSTTVMWDDSLFRYTFDLMTALFESAVRLAFPIIVVSFFIDLAFGLINRVAPQINAYFLSLPAKMVGGLLLLFFLIPFALDDFTDHYRHLTRFFYALVGMQ